MTRITKNLNEYVRRVMKLKGLTLKDVQRLSGERITDAYVASISIGRASNPSVDKLKALADGLGVDVNELFHVACGLPEQPAGARKDRHSSDPLMILETVQKAVGSPEVTEILHEVVCLSPGERADLLRYIKRLGSMKPNSRRKTKRT